MAILEEKIYHLVRNKGKIECFYCGRPGHIKPECMLFKRDKERGTIKPFKGTQRDKQVFSERKKGPKFTGKCNFCGKTGHKEQDCYRKRNKGQKSEDKHPKGRIRQVEEAESEDGLEDEAAFSGEEEDQLDN